MSIIIRKMPIYLVIKYLYRTFVVEIVKKCNQSCPLTPDIRIAIL